MNDDEGPVNVLHIQLILIAAAAVSITAVVALVLCALT